MAIKSPATYSDWYWANSVEAQIESLNQAGEDFKKYIPNVLAEADAEGVLPFGMGALYTALIESPSPGLLRAGTGMFNQVTGSGVSSVLEPALRKCSYWANRKFSDKHVTFDQACNLYYRKKCTPDFFTERALDSGLGSAEAELYYYSQMPYPSVPDIFRYARYHGNPENIRTEVWDKLDVDAGDIDMWDWLTREQITLQQAHILYRRGYMDDRIFAQEAMKIGWLREDVPALIETGWLMPNAMLLTQANLLNEVEEETLIAEISKADIHPLYARKYLDAVRTKPSTSDLLEWLMRNDSSLADADRQLRRLGVHPAYNTLYKELAYIIPPVQDLITMAVREAFSPAIAERFGQYQDYPPEFTEYAAKKGLTEDWAKRYWASHWSLPSPSQGFEMFQRNIITREELELLLRALDIMPYWRDRLIQMAYKPYTRIDVRRMYQAGVLDESAVKRAYLDLGYNEEKASGMTAFVKKDTLTKQARFSSTDIVKAYTTRLINRSTANSLLSDIGIDYQARDLILKSADYKKEWDYKDEVIRGVRNQYKKEVITEQQARDQLSTLGVPHEQIDVFMKQWYFEVKELGKETWTTTQTLSFLKNGLISESRARQELKLLGYNDERANIYVRNALLKKAT